ncbi:MAG TPA: glycosyl hydrolase family 18 protein [Clostridia bacterium]|nr:glycosyl hydrolase family 18 protein [Clostridia bacterium]
MIKFRSRAIFALSLLLAFSMLVVPVYAAKKTYTAPTATNVNVSGSPSVGQTLTGNYTYYDASGVPQGTSVYQWLYSASSTGTYYPISGAVSKTYTLTANDAGRYIRFQVTPVAAWGSPSKGTSVQSTAVGPVINSTPTPPPTSSSKVVLGYTVKNYSTDVTSYNSIVNNTKSIDQIATANYSTDGYGKISGTAPADQVGYANNSGIKPLILISNNFDSSIAKSLLESSTNRQAFINNLVNVIGANGYKGVNIDLESVPYSDRAYYTQFIADIKNTLSPLGYLTTISVPAKTSDSATNSWSGAYDYAALGKTADEIVIMTYDEHGTWTSAGPVASLGWVTNVVNYAKSVIPASKILLGLAAYGYDWSSAGNKALSLNQIDNLVSTYGGSVQWDAASESPYYSYTDTNGAQHTIWFENSSSIGYKCDLANQNSLLGVGIWRLGLEDSAYWSMINSKFNR